MLKSQKKPIIGKKDKKILRFHILVTLTCFLIWKQDITIIARFTKLLHKIAKQERKQFFFSLRLLSILKCNFFLGNFVITE